ncbi:hypothetical protein CfE428DRAFT_3651 [Chthoniobacter flavus Ellin428]|uniref:Uncharacterized protein n=1 Tax=Chthoniobacter flavus Ellin428 TaxID=497964 RepID=B4D413_9BACT|nr:hypothetical protein [Chthoniobacter flavus]EDY18993.1 hypothetical protein CfE428DRAFT_3651 [Chthoniobacter flavus Ellin428]TCO93574.1 hypothetical protein EV701_104278 [Chthoniobacter flavus]
MKRYFLLLASLLAATAAFGENGRNIVGGDTSTAIDKANVLPLALDDAFQFRKQIVILNDPQVLKPSFDPMINFERTRLNYGALNSYERRSRYGHYFKFFWRSKRKADLTVRFEYRQQNLGAFVQAKEYHVKDAKGSYVSEFDVLGDQYIEDGKVAGWRVILIENGKIVGLNQSFLWN